ncbi:MAG: histidine kinase dimerization/phosphoacceptor domain-containing protein, partial [Deltaproteobacteria bacterium]|nr:histidine kinase dimerization/phosphoacceptor domain-containing protein [Deltaproteobacteria bacterium]
MRQLNGGSSLPPVEKTLTRVVVLMRWLGWAWMLILVAVGWVEHPDASRAVLASAAIVGTAQTGLLLAATRRGFLGNPWFVALDGAVSLFLMAAAWIADAPEFIAGGYPMSWLFVVAYAANLRWVLLASLLTTGYFAGLHFVMEKDVVRTAGTIMFIVVGVVAGWTFDSLREREDLRLRAEREREEAERELAAQREAATRLRERTEIARELHDSVLQTLKLISSSAG